jgi:tRNA modification GTPase
VVTLDDTIAAIATAPGEAGLAVVRVSGQDAVAIADRVFRGTNPLASVASHTLHHGWAVEPPRAAPVGRDAHAAGAEEGSRIDEVVAAVFRSPRSYTREDVVELSCHGGRHSADHVLAALLAAGARLATAGEFSLRAFLNGRIDLAQAEAVADLIHAETDAAHALALAQLAGGLSRELHRIADSLADALADVEARVDFAEDVGGIEVPSSVIDAIDAEAAGLARLLSGSALARAAREGVRVPLVGRPNVGKSSLFNALVGEDRAIVTDVPGTTRDRVSEPIELSGIRLTLSDTAGLHHSDDAVEAIGIARAEEALADSAVAVWVVDGSRPLEASDARVAERLAGKRVLVAINKRDLGEAVRAPDVEALLGNGSRAERTIAVPVSAARGDGLEGVRAGLLELMGTAEAPAAERDEIASSGRVYGTQRAALPLAVSNARHIDALARAQRALERAGIAGRDGAPGEIVALELREVLDAIGEVTGTSVGPDLLERIFSRFCVGK